LFAGLLIRSGITQNDEYAPDTFGVSLSLVANSTFVIGVLLVFVNLRRIYKVVSNNNPKASNWEIFSLMVGARQSLNLEESVTEMSNEKDIVTRQMKSESSVPYPTPSSSHVENILSTPNFTNLPIPSLSSKSSYVESMSPIFEMSQSFNNTPTIMTTHHQGPNPTPQDVLDEESLNDWKLHSYVNGTPFD